MTLPLDYRDFERDSTVEDFPDDRWGGEITVERCRRCGTLWLRYFIEHPNFTASGRWCRAPVTGQDLRTLTSDSVLAYLATQPFYIYGGSFFGSTGEVGYKPFDPAFWVRTR